MDIIEFAEKYISWYQPGLNGRQTGVKLKPYEKEYLTNLVEHKYTITSKSRQMHITTLLSVYVAHFLIFNTSNPQSIIYFGVKLDNAYEFLDKVREIIENYYGTNKEYLTGAINTKKDLKLNNGNRIRVATPSVNAMCSFDIQKAIYDDAGFMDNFKSMYESTIATLSGPCGMHIVSNMTSTYNFFNEVFDSNNNFKKMRIHYSKNPEFYTSERIAHLKDHMMGNWDTEMNIVPPAHPQKEQKKLSYTFRLSEDLSTKLNNRVMTLDIGFSEYIRNLIMADLKA